ncbi:MAG TPA: aminotransferase class I/II-fold pyridoxal phosphate-dependent enzyme, partial [Burkholderiaceae bacterium]
NQRIVAEVIKDGFLDRHVPGIRTLYRKQRNAMLGALEESMHGLGVQWNQPEGGMFLWLRLPEGVNAATLLPRAVAHGVAYVPGEAFYASAGDTRTLRLSFVTASTEEITTGIAALAQALREQIATTLTP